MNTSNLKKLHSILSQRNQPSPGAVNPGIKAVRSRRGQTAFPTQTSGESASSMNRKILRLAQREKLLKRRLNSQILNSLNFETILETAINEIRQILGIECCQFLWYRPHNPQPEFQPIRNICQLKKVCSGCLPPKTPAIEVLGEVLLEKKLLRVDDITRDPQISPIDRESLQARGIKSLLALTIHTRSQEVGVIVCETRKRPRSWHDEEVEFLVDLADRLTIAIDHARLYEQSCMSAAIAEARAQKMEQALADLAATQTQLIQTEKMSSLGLLVAGVAHEINNPVNFIHGNLQYAQQYAEDILKLLQLYQQHYPQPVAEIQQLKEAIELDFVRGDFKKLLSSMELGTHRIQGIVKSLCNFSRVDEAHKKPVNIHEGLDSTLLILKNRLKANSKSREIEILREYGDLPLVECYPGQLNQVFMNILVNAIDALESSPSSQERPDQIRIRTERSDRGIAISIADNGPGIPEDVLKQLFDPFFTTKPVGKGTGLGLSISHQIVIEKHKGKLQCFSSPGQGTEFRIEIPIAV